MKFSKEVTINAPAEKIWDIIGHNFADIRKYDELVSSSVINHDLPKLNGSLYGGRICETSFGTISEKFVAYDEEGMTFSFQGDIKSPVFSNVTNTVAVTAVNDKLSLRKIASQK